MQVLGKPLDRKTHHYQEGNTSSQHDQRVMTTRRNGFNRVIARGESHVHDPREHALAPDDSRLSSGATGFDNRQTVDKRNLQRERTFAVSSHPGVNLVCGRA
jgi:hypothetical protein